MRRKKSEKGRGEQVGRMKETRKTRRIKLR
jgi:hypothetical protein